jgi:two-component system chemotaxis response regulator CheB
LKRIKERGGLTIVQDPATAEAPAMPEEAIRLARPDHVLAPSKINELLAHLHKNKKQA